MAAQRAGAHRGLYWSAVLLAVIALVAGAVLAYLGLSAKSGPDGAVRGYFTALQRGDAAAALAFGDIPGGRDQPLLTAAVLREQQRIAPIRHVHVVSVSRVGDDARVNVSYVLGFDSGAEPVSDTVAVHKDGSTWRLRRVAIPTEIDLTQATERATIAGAAVPSGTVDIFPGALPITFDTPYLRLAAGADSDSVSFATGAQISPDVEVSPAGRTAMAHALQAGLRQCLKSGGAGRCPLPSDRYVPGSLHGTLDGDVADAMTLDVDADATGVITASGTVAFTGSYRKLDFDDQATSRTGTIQLPLSSVAYAVAPLVIQWTAAP